jgi:hypothetical protein
MLQEPGWGKKTGRGTVEVYLCNLMQDKRVAVSEWNKIPVKV